MKFDDDDLKDGKLWAALQKEIDRDLTENGNGETFQKELEDIEDSIETENEKEETKNEYRIQNETANLSSLRSILEETERAKEEEMRQKKSRTNVEPETQDMEFPEFSEEKKEQTNQEYLQDIVNELLADEEWELPKELRFWLMGTYTWELLYL